MRNRNMPAINVAALMAGLPAGVLCAPRNDAGDVEQLLAAVREELGKLSSDLNKTAEEALKQAKQAGTTTDEVKATADKLLTNQSALTAAQAKLEGKLEILETRNQDLDQMLAARRPGGADNPKSMGEQVAEAEALKAYAKAGSKGTIRVPVNMITSSPGSAGGLIVPDRETAIVGLPRRQMTIRQLLTVNTTASNSVEYSRQVTRSNQAAPVSEGAEKPESNYEWEEADALVRTIAHWVPVSRQAMDDAKQLQGEIDGELRHGLDLAEELQILKGSGIGQNLEGLVTAATAFAAAFSVVSETEIDLLRLAVLQASLAEFPADGIVLNPTDWARLELLKDGEQRYLFASIVQMAGPQIWGKPVIQTQSMEVDEFLVGAFLNAATIYDRMETEVVISSEDRDNFVKNRLTVRAEKRLALAIKRPAALVTGDFGNVT